MKALIHAPVMRLRPGRQGDGRRGHRHQFPVNDSQQLKTPKSTSKTNFNHKHEYMMSKSVVRQDISVISRGLKRANNIVNRGRWIGTSGVELATSRFWRPHVGTTLNKGVRKCTGIRTRGWADGPRSDTPNEQFVGSHRPRSGAYVWELLLFLLCLLATRQLYQIITKLYDLFTMCDIIHTF